MSLVPAFLSSFLFTYCFPQPAVQHVPSQGLNPELSACVSPRVSVEMESW